MKNIFFIVLFLINTTMFAHTSFTVQPTKHLLSTEFDLYSADEYLCTVETVCWHLHRCYTVSYPSGEQVCGTARLLSLGALFNALKEIDITDSQGETLGLIEGHWWTDAARKFFLYDAAHQHYATAYVEKDYKSISIVDAKNEKIKLATFVYKEVAEDTYQWEGNVHKHAAIPQSTLYVLSAFIADTCTPFYDNSFCEDHLFVD